MCGFSDEKLGWFEDWMRDGEVYSSFGAPVMGEDVGCYSQVPVSAV